MTAVSYGAGAAITTVSKASGDREDCSGPEAGKGKKRSRAENVVARVHGLPGVRNIHPYAKKRRCMRIK